MRAVVADQCTPAWQNHGRQVVGTLYVDGHGKLVPIDNTLLNTGTSNSWAYLDSKQ